LLKERTNSSAAFHWFRQSANRGHPHSAYNLAAGHLSGYKTDVQKGINDFNHLLIIDFFIFIILFN
jgi:TPR repeat protein